MAPAWRIEIDTACQSVIRYHDSETPLWGDIREVPAERLAPVDLIVGGSPCQDLSVAGAREGLDGERSGLFHELVRIADSQPAAWILWENVDGALSSSEGRDFGIVLRELSGFWPSVPEGGWRGSGFCIGPKRWLVWRVLDSQYFGVAQRRRRVYVVGGPGDAGGMDFDRARIGGRLLGIHPEVLLEPDCLPGNPPPRREAGAGVASALMAGASGIGAEKAAGGQLIAHTLRGEGFDASEDGTGRGTPIVVARPLTTRPGKAYDETTDTFIPVAYHLAQITSGENRANPQPGDPPPALNGDPRLAVAFQERGRPGGRSLEWQEEQAYALTAPNGGGRGQERCIAFQCHGSDGGPADTLRTGNGGVAGKAPCFVVDGQNASAAEDGVCGTLQGEALSRQNRGFMVASTLKGHHQPSYDAAGSGPGPVNMIPSTADARRLTPRECERLQGYPDDWTRFGIRPDGRRVQLKDSPRYRMIGNGVTRNVAAWIARRIAKCSTLHPEIT
jgi:DNA (cytosine-5)-methyltransferase 1